LPKKQELIDKLKRFREALLKLKIEAEPTKEDEEDDDDSEIKFYNHTIDLLKSVVSLNDVIINKKIGNAEKTNGKHTI
jgi:soluble cytochrome b562